MWCPGEGASPQPTSAVKAAGWDTVRDALPTVRPQPLSLNASWKHVAPGEGGFSVARLRSESKKRGTSARSALVPRVFEAFGTRTSG